MVKLVSRRNMGWSRYSPAASSRVRSGVALHYNGGATGLRKSASHSKCISYWRGTASYHRSKWSDIGYAWGVCPHGYTFEGRGFDKVQAAQPGGNSSYQSITLMIGGSERPGATHIAAVKETIAWLRSRGVANRIKGHRDFNATSCPGNIIYSMLRNGAFTPGGSWSGSVGGGGGSASMKYWDVGAGLKLPRGNVLLRKGNSGLAVSRLQKGLLRYDDKLLPKYGQDSDFGNETRSAVRKFQRREGLSVDGVYGPNTAKKLRAKIDRSKPSSGGGSGGGSGSAKYWDVGAGLKLPTGSVLLNTGDSGLAVSRLQKGLLRYDKKLLPKYGQDGDFGDETRSAVRKLQKREGLSVDGIYGPNTAKKLRSEIDRSKSSSGGDAPSKGRDEQVHTRSVRSYGHEQVVQPGEWTTVEFPGDTGAVRNPGKGWEDISGTTYKSLLVNGDHGCHHVTQLYLKVEDQDPSQEIQVRFYVVEWPENKRLWEYNTDNPSHDGGLHQIKTTEVGRLGKNKRLRAEVKYYGDTPVRITEARSDAMFAEY